MLKKKTRLSVKVDSRKKKPIKPKLKPLLIQGCFNPILNREDYSDFFVDFSITLKKMGLAEIINTNTKPYRINGIVIWPWDKVRRHHITEYGKMLGCNGVFNDRRCKPSIYFPKKYEELLKIRSRASFKHNDFDIAWCGSSYRRRRRANFDLVSGCDFKWTSGWIGTRKVHLEKPQIPFKEYITILGSSRFCLCLPGFGPKCHRDIEAISVGTVPIFTPGCCTNYFNKLIEGVHYVRANSLDDLDNIKRIGDSEWLRLSTNCLNWFNNNISPMGAYNTLSKAIEM